MGNNQTNNKKQNKIDKITLGKNTQLNEDPLPDKIPVQNNSLSKKVQNNVEIINSFEDSSHNKTNKKDKIDKIINQIPENNENINNKHENININKISNEYELQHEYKIDINKYHAKVNNRKIKIPSKIKNYITTSKYTWYNFIPKILYEQFTKMSNIYFIIIAVLQCFPNISNADGKPIILMPLCIVVFVNSLKDFYEDWKRKKSDDEENNRKVEAYDLDKQKFEIRKWKDVFVGNILKIKRGEYFPADCVLISSTDRKSHGCFIETKNLDGETNLKLKKSDNKFVSRCKDLNTFQGTLITQLPNEYIYQFNAVFEFDYDNNFNDPQINNDNKNLSALHNQKMKSKTQIANLKELIPNENIENSFNEKNKNEKLNNIINNNIDEDNISEHTYYTRRSEITDRNCTFESIDSSSYNENKIDSNKRVFLDNNNFLLRGCSLRQTESVLCFVVYAGKNTKIMQNSPGARSKTSSVEKRLNQQIKYIFFLQILLGLLASILSLYQIISKKKDPAPYLYSDKNDRPFNFEKYSKMFYKILSKENMKQIFNKNENAFILLKNFFSEISPLFDIDVIQFFLIKFGTWCVLLNNLVPISLLMTLELVKYFQGWFISWDIDIYDIRKKLPTRVLTSTLNEELGQVKYIFSDKTGTLTKNKMKFKRVSIGINQYNPLKEFKSFEESSENNMFVVKKIEEKAKKNMDEYGKIINVDFEDDAELIKNLGLEKLFINQENNNNIEKLDNEDINTNIDKNENENENENELINSNIDISENNLEVDTLNNKSNLNDQEINDLFMTALATCHSGLIDEKEFNTNKKLKYQASSPDEIALMYFARKYKYIFMGRKDNTKIIIHKPSFPNVSSLTEYIYQIPFQFEYSSERKSMSTILQSTKNPNEIYLFIKGADSVILNKLQKNNEINKTVINNLNDALDKYAKEGLRILAVAYKKLNIDELNEYYKEYLKACKSTYKKKEKLENLAEKVEKELILLGVTGVEDELQDNVNQTLKDFSEAGIKLWVLTGDKKDTAKSIAYSCGLFNDSNFNIFEINEGLNKAQLEARLNELVELFNSYVDKMNINKSKQIKILQTQNDENSNNNDKKSNKKKDINNLDKKESIQNDVKIDIKEANDNNEKNINKEIKNNKNDNEINNENNNNEDNINNDNIINNDIISENSVDEGNNNNNKENNDIIFNDETINDENNNDNDNKNNINNENNNIENNNNLIDNNINTNKKKRESLKIKPKFALVISSDELNLLSLNYELEILFYELSSRCNSVLCCRVSPIQKAKMVHLIQRFTKIQEHKGTNYYKYLNQNETKNSENKKNNKNMSPLRDSVITLAIGDGANDVNMITSAHIGIGIMGVEGKQAARASDYAIGQFKFLKKLLFFHGHESLRKNSFTICYTFYKNFLFVMPLFFVGFYSLFSGQTIYDPWLYQLYNLVFTVLPIMWFGIYDSERTITVAMSNAKFYSLNVKLFTGYKLWSWIFYGILQGFMVFFFVFSSNNIYANNINGDIQDFKSSGAITYSIVIIIVNLKVFQKTSVHGFISIFFLIFSIGSYFLLTFLMSNHWSMFYFGVFVRVIKNFRYYLIVICLCVGLTFIGAGFVYISNLCRNYDTKIKHDKIMYSYYKDKEKQKAKELEIKKKKSFFKKKIGDKIEKKKLIEE